MRFHQFMGCVAAFLLATWAFIIALFVGTFALVPVSYTVVLAHVVVLGLPIFLIFWWMRWVNVITCICGGFLVAAASGIVPNWPVRPEGSNVSVRGVGRLVVDGVPTLAGWLDLLQVVIFLGVFGAIAGVVFWVTLRASGMRAPAATGTDRWQRHSAISLGVVAVLLTGTVFAIPGATWGRILRPVDQTCHNVLRDRDAISPQISMDLQIAQGDLPKLMRAMQDFATTHKLRFRDASVPTQWFISLCNDRGVTIRLQLLVAIGVFELQPGSGWQQPTKELIDRLETSWPGKLRFRSATGGYMPRPQELL